MRTYNWFGTDRDILELRDKENRCQIEGVELIKAQDKVIDINKEISIVIIEKKREILKNIKEYAILLNKTRDNVYDELLKNYSIEDLSWWEHLSYAEEEVNNVMDINIAEYAENLID